MGKQSAEELRKEVLEEDNRKDVSIYLSVPVGVVAGISALAALTAVISMRALVYFRSEVDAYWLSCVPFLFPVITGLFAAYKKQFSLFGVHVVVTLLALLMGGFGFALAVGPVFFDRNQCVPAAEDMSCNKTTLAYLFMVSGCISAGAAGLGLLMTLCGLNSASKRISKRRHDLELQHLEEQEKKQKEARQVKAHADKNQMKSFSPAPNASTNGISQGSPDKTANGDNTKGDSDVMTKL